MIAKFFDRLRGASAILLPGGVAVAIVARTLAVYWGRDWLATAVVSAIACALAIGLLESFARQRRLEQLERELRALPRTPDESALDRAGPQVAALLRARLEHQPSPPSSDGMAPFLAGLLVMLGLLGTLLGLFQTLHGAGHALTSSADLEALRHGLSAPIAGLTRSFGCAAAGISASAMLGLASALLRRREARIHRALSAYALGPLREQSASARQLRAIEQLASHASALPAAANGLLQQLAASGGEALERQSAALSEVAKNLARELEQDAARRRSDAAQALHAMRVRLDEAESARAAAHAKELAALRERSAEHATRFEQLSNALHAELEQRLSTEQRRAERLDQVLTQLSAAAAAIEHGTRQNGSAIEGLVERVAATLPELVGAAQAGAVHTLQRLRELGEEQAERLAQLEAALSRERSEHSRSLVAQLEGHAAGIEDRLTRTSGAVEEAAAIWRASTVEMQAVAQLFASSVERQREAAEAWLESLGAIESAVEQAGRDAASDALSEQLTSTQELFARQLQFQRELLNQLRTFRGGSSKLRAATGDQDVPPGE